jgi:hypothetical protein
MLHPLERQAEERSQNGQRQCGGRIANLMTREVRVVCSRPHG